MLIRYLISDYQLQRDLGFRGQFLRTIGFPMRLSVVSLVMDCSGLISLI